MHVWLVEHLVFIKLVVSRTFSPIFVPRLYFYFPFFFFSEGIWGREEEFLSPLLSQVLWCVVKESFSLIVRHSLVFDGRVPLVPLVVLVWVLYHYPYLYCPLLLFIVPYCPFIVHCCPLLPLLSIITLYCPFIVHYCPLIVYLTFILSWIFLRIPILPSIVLYFSLLPSSCPIFSLSFPFVPIQSHLLSILCPILYYPLSIDPIIDIYSLVPFLVLYYPLSWRIPSE